MERILVINLGWEQQPLVEELLARGYLVYGVHSTQVDIPGLQELHVCDLRDLASICKFATEKQVEAVVSDQCDYSHFAQAYVCENLHLAGPSILQAQISGNKSLQRSLASERGVRVPQFQIVRTLQDAGAAAARLKYPLITKPVDNRGSIGVHKVSGAEALARSFFSSLAESHSRLVVMEEFIDGIEVTVDGYCFGGKPRSLALARKKHLNNEIRVAMEIEYPGDLAPDLYEKVLTNNEFVLESLGYSFGMTHAEYLIDADENIYLVEAANRGGGVFTSEIIVPQVSGVDLVDCLIGDVVGGSCSPPPKITRVPTILKFFSFPPGLLKSIEVPPSIGSDPEVLKFKVLVSSEGSLTDITSDANRHGFLILSSSQGNVSSKAQDHISGIKLTYER